MIASPVSQLRLSGENLAQARERAGFSVELLAGLVGVSTDVIRRAEAGTNEPRSSTLATIAAVIGASMESLFEPVAQGAVA